MTKIEDAKRRLKLSRKDVAGYSPTMQKYLLWASKYPKLAGIVGDNAYVMSVYIGAPQDECEAMIREAKKDLVKAA